ncbi:MAG: bifunctional phosphoserine phosphatase/homoserine phosphotransferase ThrH [Candidatus Azotimanducaceae bacterium]|uniref:phosphoserine phosphatase n=1 Tax=OM182 bacterium TaxID=2510334 RepID=A0A520S0D2_9GAMM|nr:bifunctional phosphoserine phosphatase/homoserine phosphotransferase ThrH [Gammaproteobacteria bacterium]OUV67831.1 MAG: bifunctional phosphoserine phosphatase/homoserine phosphotransferase ThrH [Gammaproteobacteria bacterium TMED133]RZO75931.1 MAG: bifunctional phosphoserine phosphatase/homoserine phosphotransferase ThrH [OM182 bacterium]
MQIICLDLEGVLIPEIWIEFAKETGIEELMATTRDIPDYDVLMKQRLSFLRKNDLRIDDIQSVISGMEPLDGAKEFLNELRSQYQVMILSDTFYEFAYPFMQQLAWPTLLCHRLMIDSQGGVENYVLRQKDPKRNAVKAMKQLNFRVFAAGDSYNDTTMLEEADAGFLFCAPDNVVEEFPEFPLTTNYDELLDCFKKAELDE